MTPDLLLLHGALGSREQMVPLAGAIGHDTGTRGASGGAAYRTVHAIDFGGHGARAGEQGEFSVGRFADNIIEFLDEQGVAKADIFGYSMGGYAALLAARKAPARIGRIMTLGTKFAWDPATARKEASRLEPPVIESKVPAFAAQLRRRHGDAWPDVVRATAKMMLALGERPALGPEEFSSIPHEVFVTVGEKDTMVTAEESALAGSSLPAGRSLVLPGVPHPFEQVDLANLLVHMKKFFGLGRQD